jgi:fumarate hydratase subunit alpha
MRDISAEKIKDVIIQLCVQANIFLRNDVLGALSKAIKKENSQQAKRLIKLIIKNACIAKEKRRALCQDTGMVIVFVEKGDKVVISGSLKKAINEGVLEAYKENYFRASIIQDPLYREKPRYTPAIIHIQEGPLSQRIILTVMVKGFGCENKSQLKMFNPTASLREIKDFIIQTIKNAGPDACPPFIVGIGIGGTQEQACYLAKKSLLNSIIKKPSKEKDSLSCLEKELLTEINRLGIGPLGLGGKTTCLGVNIKTYPTHIAGLPVAVNINCHSLRTATRII